MAEVDPGTQWNERLAQDPTFQQLEQAARGPIRTQEELRANERAQQAVYAYIQQLGLPAGLAYNPTSGQIEKKKGDFPTWSKYAMMGIGGVAAAPFIAGALAGGGGAAAGAGGSTAAAGMGSGGALGTAAAGGGLASTIGTGLKLAGPALSALSQGRAAGRVAEQNAAQNLDRTRLGAAEFNRQNPQVRRQSAVHGDILAGVQDYQMQGEGRNLSATGGLRPSLLSAGTRQLGSEQSRQALLSQMGQGGAQDPYGTFTPTPTPQAGKLDTGLNVAGTALSLWDLYRQAKGGA